MLLIDFDREVFQPLARGRRYAEIGVYKGAYAMGVRNYSPARMDLIDPWRINLDDLVPSDYHADDSRTTLRDAMAGYYPVDVNEALDQAFRDVVKNFSGTPNCNVIRDTSKGAVSLFDAGAIDYLYIDANHRYDFVLADLERWHTRVSSSGVIVLNDCYVSPVGKRQHVSVLEALSTFIKLYDWKAVAMVNRPWTDVIIARSDAVRHVETSLLPVLLGNNVPFVNLPASLVHSARHVVVRSTVGSETVQREMLSFGD